MTDAVDRRYEEAVANLTKTHGNHDEGTARCILDDIGFRALLEIEEAARDVLDYAVQLRKAAGRPAMENGLFARLRAALAARATETGDSESPDKATS